jgi:outer membrane autotransporter protein
VGDEEQLRGDPELNDDENPNGVWGRFIAKDVRHHTDRGIYGTGPSYKMDSWAFQGGIDIYRAEDDEGDRDHAGIYGVYGEADSRVTHQILDQEFAGGTVTMKNGTLGAYWTHFEEGGEYLDAVVQATWLNIHVRPRRLAEVRTDGFSLAASLEGGYPLEIDDDWRLEPQAQLIYQTLSLDDMSDVASTIRFRDLNSLAGRIGARLNNIGDELGWIRVNLWHEFTGHPKTEFSTETGFLAFEAELPRTWWEIDAGVSWHLDRNTTLFGAGSYNSTFDGDSKAYDAKIGVRYNW